MKWNRYDIETTADATDLICAIISELGIDGVEIQDKKGITKEEADGMFVDIIPDAPEDDGSAIVSFYLSADEPEENSLKLSELKLKLAELKETFNAGSCDIKESVTDDADWANNWKKYWHTFRINDLFIKPTWEDVTPEMQNAKVISLDPGRAFGTGSHETTRLVIGRMQEIIKSGDKVLDVGCGSGILSIVAMVYGASEVLGVDLDKMAITASYENIKENGIDESKVDFLMGDIISDDEFKERCGLIKYDLVCANILPDVLVPLTATVDRHMKPGARLIYSGILNEKVEEVTGAIEGNGALEVIDVISDGEWSSVTARKK